ncbi:MAG: ATP-binding cassette domain-containing protein [Bacteroidota bacterium]
MLKTTEIHFTYPHASSLSFPALEAGSGNPLLILGRSGVGKTTLLHLLAGFLRPKQGEIWIEDTNLASLSEEKLDRFRGQQIGVIFQQAHFVQSLKVGQNLMLTQYLAQRPIDKSRAQDILTSLGLVHKWQTPTHQLSLGEQQRISIARAVINRPKLLLADEPTSALDDQSTEEVISLLQQSAQEAQAALVIVTHDQRLKDRFENQIELG